MAILIRTSDVPPEELRDAWRAVVCDTLGPLDFRSDPDIPLQGEIAAGQLGPVNVGRVETSTPHSVYRTAGLIRRDSPELYRVALTMSGRAGLLQDGRTAQLRPGEFTLYDFTPGPTSWPTTRACSSRCSASRARCWPCRATWWAG